MSELVVALDVSAIPERIAGAGRYVTELVRALEDRDDLSLGLLARRDDASRWENLAATAPLQVVARAPSRTPLRIAYGEFLLGRDVGRIHPAPNVFHGPHYTVPRGLTIAECVTVHDLTLVEHPEWHEPSKVRFFGRAIVLAARRCRAIVLPSRREADRFAERYRPAGEVVVIPHGIDHSLFRADEPQPGADRAALDRLGIGERYLLSLGTIEPRKNHALLVEAFDALATADPELQLVIAGQDGWGTEALGRAIARSRHGDRVLRVGYVSDADVPALLRRAACVVYPSSAEGFGIPVIEALACGAPVVTTAETPMADAAGEVAVLVEIDNLDALTDAVVAVLAETPPTVAAARRASGIARAATFTWARSAASHVEVWTRSLAARPTS